MTLTRAGGTLVRNWSPCLVVSLCGGSCRFFPEMEKRMAHYTEPYNRKSNLVKLLVLHPLENLYTLSFGSSPQRGLKAWYPVGIFGAAPREKYGFFSENVGKKRRGGFHHRNASPIQSSLIWTDVRGPKAREETHLNGRLRAEGPREQYLHPYLCPE